MDNFMNEAINNAGNLDGVLSNVTDKILKKATSDSVSKQFNQLFNAIDLELKSNDELNKLINEVVEKRKILTYDVKSNFMNHNYFYYGGEDVYTGSEFDQERYDDAKKHLENWQTERQTLEQKIEKLQNGIFKSLLVGRVKSLQEKIASGDRKYERVKKIFDEEKEMSNIDKVALEKEVREKIKTIKAEINGVIEKHILEAIKKDPSIITYDAFFGDKYPFISSSQDSTEHNKNIYKYFDSSEINKKLSNILKTYNSQKYRDTTTSESAPEPGM